MTIGRNGHIFVSREPIVFARLTLEHDRPIYTPYMSALIIICQAMHVCIYVCIMHNAFRMLTQKTSSYMCLYVAHTFLGFIIYSSICRVQIRHNHVINMNCIYVNKNNETSYNHYLDWKLVFILNLKRHTKENKNNLDLQCNTK